MPKQINTYTFGQALVRKFGLKGRFQPVLDETIVPVTVVDSSQVNRIAVGGRIGTAAGAGRQNQIILHNPVNSGIIIKLQQWWGVSGAPLTDFVQLRYQASGGSGTGFQFWRDSGQAGVPIAEWQATTSVTVVLGGPQYHLDVDSNVWEQEWIVRPGAFLEWRQLAANDTLDIWATWTEENETQSTGA